MKRARTVHIERLLLHGVAATDRAALVRALRSELEQLLIRGEPLHSLQVPRLGGQLELSAGSSARAIGTQAARQLDSQLKAASAGAVVPASPGMQRGKS